VPKACNLIVVTFNYRAGLLGLLTHPDLTKEPRKGSDAVQVYVADPQDAAELPSRLMLKIEVSSLDAAHSLFGFQNRTGREKGMKGRAKARNAD